MLIGGHNVRKRSTSHDAHVNSQPVFLSYIYDRHHVNICLVSRASIHQRNVEDKQWIKKDAVTDNCALFIYSQQRAFILTFSLTKQLQATS